MNDQSDPNHLAAAAEQRASAEGSHLAAPVGAAASPTEQRVALASLSTSRVLGECASPPHKKSERERERESTTDK